MDRPEKDGGGALIKSSLPDKSAVAAAAAGASPPSDMMAAAELNGCTGGDEPATTTDGGDEDRVLIIQLISAVASELDCRHVVGFRFLLGITHNTVISTTCPASLYRCSGVDRQRETRVVEARSFRGLLMVSAPSNPD